jgi:hypothetical protein
MVLTCLATSLIINGLLLFANKAFPGIDRATHYQWVVQFRRALSEGVYPRWMPDSFSGLGDPSFVFAHPLFAFAASALSSAVGDVWVGMKLASLLANLAVGVIAWSFLQRYTSHGFALLGAVALQCSPLSIFLLNYAAAFPWNFSLPFVLLVIATSAGYGKRFVDVGLALSVGLAVMAHVLIGFMGVMCLGCAMIYDTWRSSGGWRKVVGWGVSCALGLLLASVVLLPAVCCQHLIATDGWFIPGYVDWRNSFIFPVFTREYGTKWFSVQWILAALPVLAAGASALLIGPWKVGGSRERRVVAMLVIASLAGLVFASELAYPLYANSQLVRTVQWPYRFLSVPFATAGLAVFIALACVWRERRSRFVLLIAVGPIALWFAVAAAQQAQIATEAIDAAIGPHLLKGEFGQPSSIPATRGPRWRDYIARGGFAEECSSKGIECRVLESKAHHRVWQLLLSQKTMVRLPVFAFPAWSVYVDGRPTATVIDAETGLISASIDPGEHTIALVWAGLPQERWGAWMSIGTALLLSGVWFWYRRTARAMILAPGMQS